MSYKHAFYILLFLFVALMAFAILRPPAVQETIVTVTEYRTRLIYVSTIAKYYLREACDTATPTEPIELISEVVDIPSSPPALPLPVPEPILPVPPYCNRHCETGEGNATRCVDEAPGQTVQQHAKLNSKH